MGEVAARRRMSYAEYVPAEASGDVKHEYVDGAAYAVPEARRSTVRSQRH